MKRSKFSLSHYKLFTCDMGELIPCGLIEVLPGDTIQQSTSLLLRCSPLLAPVMHPISVRIHHWFVPHRLVWDEWEDFITGGPDGMNASTFPWMGADAGYATGTLCDYLGIPPNKTFIKHNALPIRGYQLIWNEWYRDQDLTNPSAISTAGGVGSDATTSKNLRAVAWEKDYFTSSRPWEQKGPAITVPISGINPVTFRETGTTPGVRTLQRGSGTPGPMYVTQAGTTNATLTAEVDLTSASSVTVNVLREAMALQRYEEARARYGSRYTEYLRYLGVRSSDARLDRPEYLGGGKQTIQFSEVLQTAEGVSPSTAGVGTMRGHGLAAMRSNRYRKFFEEHGYIFSLLSVRPKTMYSQGLTRTLADKRTKEHFWQKELQHIGQQEVLRKEVWYEDTETVFGFQDRYDEYRRIENNIAGEFRDTLNYWHFGREFSSAPSLNNTFVGCVPTERPFAVQTNDVLWIMANHSIQARRMVAPQGSSFIY